MFWRGPLWVDYVWDSVFPVLHVCFLYWVMKFSAIMSLSNVSFFLLRNHPPHNTNVIMLYIVQEVSHFFKVALQFFCLDRFPLLWLTVHWSIPLYHLIYQFFFFFYFISLFFNLFYYMFFVLYCLPCCTWAFFSCIEWGSSLVVVRGIHIVVVSLVVEHRL